MDYVIVGNSAAAIGAVEGIRRMDQQGNITILTSEPHHTYSRPLISYCLGGKVDWENIRYRDEDFYTKNQCRLLSEVSAQAIDSKTKTVKASNGETIAFDKLLIAAGSRAFVLPFEGLDAVKDQFTFMSFDDAERLEQALAADKRVLIVGAGLIGLKCAEGLVGKVSHVTVVDLADRVLSSILDARGAAMVQAHLEKQGIECRLSCGVSRFEEGKAILSNGEIIGFDILVLAVGVRPNTELLSGIAQIERGIVVNGKSETSAPSIFAAGDCTQTNDRSSGKSAIMALLPNAYMQGECAGVNMAGGSASFDEAIPMNAIGFFGLHVLTAGHYGGDVYEADREGCYKRLFYKDNKLNGFIMIGDVDKAGIYTNLIRKQTPLDTLDFELLCQRPGLMAFAKADRIALLGGAAG